MNAKVPQWSSDFTLHRNVKSFVEKWEIKYMKKCLKHNRNIKLYINFGHWFLNIKITSGLFHQINVYQFLNEQKL